MNKEYQILNEKLNMIFEEMMWLKEAHRKEQNEKRVKELEHKLNDIKKEIEYTKENARFEAERIDGRMKYFRNAERVYAEPIETMDQTER